MLLRYYSSFVKSINIKIFYKYKSVASHVFFEIYNCIAAIEFKKKILKYWKFNCSKL